VPERRLTQTAIGGARDPRFAADSMPSPLAQGTMRSGIVAFKSREPTSVIDGTVLLHIGRR
jgi:hypothetical protein